MCKPFLSSDYSDFFSSQTDIICFSGGFALKRKGCGAKVASRVHCSVNAPPPAWPGRAVPEAGRKTWEGPKPISIVGSTGSIGTQV